MTNLEYADNQDLRDFATRGDQRAFSEFVNRRFNLVYSVALRALNGDHHLAKDAALQVFTDAARKARQLAHHRSIEGWLFTSARFVACKLARKRIREIRRETTAAVMTDLSQDAPAANRQELQPLLDAAIESLPSRDQRAIVLRFYGQHDYADIGGRLGVSANTARMRVERALLKLQTILSRRGITSTAAALSATLEGYALANVPFGLSASVSATVLTTASGSAFGTASLLAAAKWPLATTVAIAATGTYFLSEDPPPQHFEYIAPSASAMIEPTPAPVSLRNDPPPAQTPRRAQIDRAYAALDNDATLLAERLAQINAASESSSNRAPEVEDEQVFHFTVLDTKPSALKMRRPVYPESLVGAQIPGEVVLSFTVAKDGGVDEAEVIAASHPDFAISALQAIRESTFIPGAIGTNPVPTRIRQVIRFQPTNAEPDFDLWF